MKHSKDIIILGYSGTANECPFDTETWGINIAGKVYRGKQKNIGITITVEPRIDYCMAFDELPPEYIKEMKAIAPVISFQEYADYQYPLKEIIKTFRTEYFVNSLCYMIAYAIFIGIKRLSLYGCDTILGATWQRESKGVEYWLGRAEERGIELVLPKKSGLLKSLQGRPYHKNSNREILLSLNERIALMNMITSGGEYWDVLYEKTLSWILIPKGEEKERYNINFGYDLEGKYTAVCKEEFRIDIPMSEDVWDYLKKCLLQYEQDHGLTDNLLGIYEVITTAEWRDGEYRNLRG